MQPGGTLDLHLRLNPNCTCAVCTLFALHQGLGDKVNIALSQLSNLKQRVNEATQPNAGGNQDKGHQPIYIDLTGPDLIDLANCVNNVCQPGSCDFCNFGGPVNAEVQAWAAL